MINDHKKSQKNHPMITSYQDIVRSSGINISKLQDFFDKYTDTLTEVFVSKIPSNTSKQKGKNSQNSQDLEAGDVKMILKNPDLAAAIRELLEGFQEHKITDKTIKNLNKFRTSFDKIVKPLISPSRKINDSGIKIIRQFKEEVFNHEKSLEHLRKLKRFRLHTSISELFDFVIYLKESNHPSIKKLQILDCDDRLSYGYFIKNEIEYGIFLDDLLFANTGLVWIDKEDDYSISISSCIKLHYESDPIILTDEFNKHKNKNGKLFACYSLTQNRHITKELAQEVLAIKEKTFDFFPYPKDYSAIIGAIDVNIYTRFPDITANEHGQDNWMNFDDQFQEYKDYDETLWYTGTEFTSNSYSAKKAVYAKKYSESKNDYLEYLQCKKEWLWSISLIVDKLWIADENYGIDLTNTNVIKYVQFALEHTLEDEVFEFLKIDFEIEKKYEKELLIRQGYDFETVVGLLLIGRYINLIIKKVLRKLKDVPSQDSLYEIYRHWISYIDGMLGSDSITAIALLESHPEVFGSLWYSFEESVITLRFWIIGKKIDECRVKLLTEKFWNSLKVFRKIQHSKVEDKHLILGLFMYASTRYLFGNDEEKRYVKKEMIDLKQDDNSKKIIKNMRVQIENELKEYGSKNQDYERALRKLAEDSEEDCQI